MSPLGGGPFLYGNSAHRHLVCHCLLLELPDRLVLVDSGLGLADVADPFARLGSTFVRAMRPRLEPGDTAAQRIEELGLRTDDVRDIVLTHMDLDHAGGLSDFPHARVHVAEAELTVATTRPRFGDRHRYRPQQWAHGPEWRSYGAAGEPWHGFPAVRDLDTLPPEILMVPLVGHSMGHSGVAIDTGRGWLLHCGDAYYHRGEVDRDPPHAPALIRAFERIVADDDVARRANQARLHELFSTPTAEVTMFCAHDTEELESLRA